MTVRTDNVVFALFAVMLTVLTVGSIWWTVSHSAPICYMGSCQTAHR